tara:strand:+ start:745 stop:978 length:234 start_codon:yes stop_codon:yes gene_type:complete
MKLTNKKRSVKCNRCYIIKDVSKAPMYAIGSEWGVLCEKCWQISMNERMQNQKKTPKKHILEDNFNLDGYDENIFKK